VERKLAMNPNVPDAETLRRVLIEQPEAGGFCSPAAVVNFTMHRRHPTRDCQQ
jgi:hypothetical protein